MKSLCVEYKCGKCGFVHKMNHGPIRELPDHWKSTTCGNEVKGCSERKMLKGSTSGDTKAGKLEEELKIKLQKPKALFKDIQRLRAKVKKVKQSPQGKLIEKLKKEHKTLIKNPKSTQKEVSDKETELQNAHGFPVKTAILIKSWRE